ncbi:hypothetical protein PFLUV_G00249140 [Perca fluviatilis]|uniref:Uncharacterized protein n=1 Tax=Perca fluviatilis TaxID=8168 RepID=A0A6A5E3P6_PERFL|nr:hypothetical protein PFLUV_G00249140 [Perca fluviatilis]
MEGVHAALKMLDLRQLIDLKFGIGPVKEGPLHCVPTYLTTLRAKVKKQNSGPIADRELYREENWLTTESLCCEDIALMKHTADEAIVKEKMKQTFSYRQKMVHDPIKASEIFTAFPRFLDIAGMIEQDFNLMFGDATSAEFLEKWPTVYKH